MKKKVRTRVTAIQCLKCKDIIYSCAPHDFRNCSCNSVFIDGGFNYVRVGGFSIDYKVIHKYIPVTRQQLYNDWNQNGERKYGCIKP